MSIHVSLAMEAAIKYAPAETDQLSAHVDKDIACHPTVEIVVVSDCLLLLYNVCISYMH